jgi:hypothetical protein
MKKIAATDSINALVGAKKTRGGENHISFWQCNANNLNRSTSRPRVKHKQRSKSQSRIDFESLGIKNLCIRCGRDNRTTKECNTDRNSLKCSACKRSGHIKKACIKSLLDIKSKASTAKPEFANYICDKEALDYYGVNQIIDLFQNHEATSQNRDKYRGSRSRLRCRLHLHPT